MKKWQLHLIGFVSMVLTGAVAFLIMINDGGNWTAVPIVIWFVLGQIFLVPKILRSRNGVDKKR